MASALSRDTDFTETMSTTIASWPTMTNARFDRWIDATHATKRYPGGIGYGFVAYVPAAKLPAFGRRMISDPTPTSLPTKRFTVIPPGRRPYYCLLRLVSATAGAKSPIGMDECAAGIPGVVSQSPKAAYAASRDTGQITVVPLDATHGLFGVSAPVYRGARTPATVTGRRAALLGWAGGTFDSKQIIAQAGGVVSGLRVTISHRNPGERSVVLASGGTSSGNSATLVTPVAAAGAWTVAVTGAVPVPGLSAAAQFWLILLGGLVFSLLLFGFVRVLALSRGQAIRLVAKRTEELRHLALHDGLTGLPNRELILDRVESALARARRQHTQLAVMFLDLDGFKDVNDSFGHAVGDQLLQAVSERLKGVLRESDTVGRLGGDEFIVIAEAGSLAAGPEPLAGRIRDALAAPFVVGNDQDITVGIHASIGIAVGVHATANDTLRDADIALYEAKETGKDRCVIFAPAMYDVVEKRVELEHDLREALENEQFVVHYQPTVDLATETLTGVEALVRWQHPTRGLVMPHEFIPLAESNGLIVPLGRRVLEIACQQGAEWQRRGTPLDISVNVSGRQLDADANFVHDVEAALATSGLDGTALILELTETALLDDVEESNRQLHQLKDLGVRIAIDDFGTGYSSLEYLQEFPVDRLKIDRSFISGASTGTAESRALIHTIIQIGKNLGIQTLAEGVETTAQLRHLQSEGCNRGQGYLFSRPLDLEGIEEFLDREHVWSVVEQLVPS